MRQAPLRYSWIVLLGFFVAGLSFLRVFDYQELITYDLRFKLRPALETADDLLIIEISDDTLKNLGQWPLPRDFHATLIEVLNELGARAIVFDVLFSEPTLFDETFFLATRKASNVYFPMAFYLGEGRQGAGAVPVARAILADLLPDLKDHAAGFGHINVIVDPDGKIRRIPLFVRDGRDVTPQMSFKAACDRLGLDERHFEILGQRMTVDGKLSLPLTHDGSFIVNYPGRWSSSFRHLSYFEVLQSYAQRKQGQQPKIDLSVINNKVCFIGFTAVGTTDVRPMPLEKTYPMLGLQASVFHSILHQKFIRDAGLLWNTLLDLVVFGLALLISVRLSAARALAGNVLFAVAYFILATGLFVFSGIWVDLFCPLLIIVVTYIGIVSWRFFDEARKRELLEKELDIAREIQKSFLPPDLRDIGGLRISAFLQPAKFVAGDLYDIVMLDDKKIGVLIGDVSGKGVPASLIMAQTISLFRVFARQYRDCGEVLRQLNREVSGKFSGRFVTCLYLIIDSSARGVRVSSAGHSPVLLYRRRTSELSEVDLNAEMPLGIADDVEYKDVLFDFEKGDKIVLFTDGVSEARNKNNQEYGLARAKDVISKNAGLAGEKLCEAIKNDIFTFSSGAPQHDDMTLMVLEQ